MEVHLVENLSNFPSFLTGFCYQISKIKTLDNWNLQQNQCSSTLMFEYVITMPKEAEFESTCNNFSLLKESGQSVWISKSKLDSEIDR